MKSRFPLLLVGLMALTVPTVGVGAPGDRPGLERRGEHRAQAAEKEQRFLDAMALKDPERHRKVVEIRSSRPIMYRQLLRQAGQDLRMRNQDPGAWGRVEQMIDQTHLLAGHLDAWETADERARNKLRKTIEEDVGRLFELRQAHRRAQLAQMEQRIERMRGDIAERDSQKDEIVEEFTGRMLRQVDRRR